MKRLLVLWLAVMILATAGCAGMSARQQRALSGGAIGASVGPRLAPLRGAVRRLGLVWVVRPGQRPAISGTGSLGVHPTALE
jgi:hypothetical protein